MRNIAQTFLLVVAEEPTHWSFSSATRTPHRDNSATSLNNDKSSKQMCLVLIESIMMLETLYMFQAFGFLFLLCSIVSHVQVSQYVVVKLKYVLFKVNCSIR